MANDWYMVIETFRKGANPLYQCFAAQGRMLSDGLTYIDCWLTDERNRCFQLIEALHRKSFDNWTCHWNDLVDFEIMGPGPKPQPTA